MSATQLCPKCQKRKAEAEFPPRKNPANHSQSRHCLECSRAWNRGWSRRNRETLNERSRKHHLRTKYGLTLEEFEVILQQQGGVCAICHRPPNGRVLDVDHNHKTGQIRGLLCLSCNAGIGSLGDSPEMLKRATAYLQQADKCSVVKLPMALEVD